MISDISAGAGPISGDKGTEIVRAVLDRPVAPVVDDCRGQGLIVLSAGPEVLRLTPPLVVAADEVDEALGVLAAVLGA